MLLHVRAGRIKRASGSVRASDLRVRKAADAVYNEPTLGTTNCANAALSIWSGIGGFDGSTLAQVGTTEGGGFPVHSFFHEIIPPQGEIPWLNSSGNPSQANNRDEINAYTQYLGNNEYTLSITDGTRHFAVTDGGNGTGYDGSTAEEIVERPHNPNYTTSLMNFVDPVVMNGANGVSGLPAGGTEYIMTGYATTSSNSNGQWKVTHVSCGG